MTVLFKYVFDPQHESEIPIELDVMGINFFTSLPATISEYEKPLIIPGTTGIYTYETWLRPYVIDVTDPNQAPSFIKFSIDNGSDFANIDLVQYNFGVASAYSAPVNTKSSIAATSIHSLSTNPLVIPVHNVNGTYEGDYLVAQLYIANNHLGYMPVDLMKHVNIEIISI
jgi:hypothetical protein